MKTLTERGVSIIFISHKLKEVLRICDDLTVLRLGRVVGVADPRTTTQEMLASTMVGREVLLQVEKDQAHMGEVILNIQDLTVLDDRGLQAVKALSLQVHEGEILGIAGVQGNGQTELIEAITGLRAIVSGHIYLVDTEITHMTPRKVTETGISHVPEDRQKYGMVKAFSIRDNMRIQTYYAKPFSKGIVADDEAIDEKSQAWIDNYDVRTPNIYVNIGSLSGGNQQKAVVAREFSRPSKLLIAAQPTRGIDVGSIEFIHNQLVKMRDAGVAVLLVSTELDEIMGLSDRIAVMYAGKVIDIIPGEGADREKIGLLMAGIKEEAQHG